jgi:hypothetical protein
VESITEEELKNQGVTVFEKIFKEKKDNGVVINVRGKKKYIVLDINTYNRFRKYELEIVLAETKLDLAKGDFLEESVEDHIKQIRESELGSLCKQE